jgi:hypothetical protein
MRKGYIVMSSGGIFFRKFIISQHLLIVIMLPSSFIPVVGGTN